LMWTHPRVGKSITKLAESTPLRSDANSFASMGRYALVRSGRFGNGAAVIRARSLSALCG
jgi:hypothetical protein